MTPSDSRMIDEWDTAYGMGYRAGVRGDLTDPVSHLDLDDYVIGYKDGRGDIERFEGFEGERLR